MAKIAALKTAWVVIGVVLIIQIMDSCQSALCKALVLFLGVVLVSCGSWLIVHHARKQ